MPNSAIATPNESTQPQPSDESWLAYPPFIWLVLAALVAGVCLWLRLDLIEPLARTAQCTAEPNQLVCEFRSFLVSLFQRERVGWVALGVSVLGVVTRWRWLLGMGLLIGSAAMMLYSVEPGAAAVLLATLFLLRVKNKG